VGGRAAGRRGEKGRRVRAGARRGELERGGKKEREEGARERERERERESEGEGSKGRRGVSRIGSGRGRDLARSRSASIDARDGPVFKKLEKLELQEREAEEEEGEGRGERVAKGEAGERGRERRGERGVWEWRPREGGSEGRLEAAARGGRGRGRTERRKRASLVPSACAPPHQQPQRQGCTPHQPWAEKPALSSGPKEGSGHGVPGAYHGGVQAEGDECEWRYGEHQGSQGGMPLVRQGSGTAPGAPRSAPQAQATAAASVSLQV